MWRWGVLLVGFLAGCSVPFEPPRCESYHRHPSLTLEHWNRVKAAATKWNALVGHEVVRLDDESSELTTCSVRSVADGSADYAAVKADAHGDLVAAWYKRENALVLVPSRLRCGTRLGDCIEGVTLHEMGHTLGLQHLPERSVMGTQDEVLLDFTAFDRVECLRVGVCVPR